MAIVDAISLALPSPRALFKILIFTTSFFSNCFSISLSNSCETCFLPTQTVGFSSLNSLLMRRFIPAVSLLKNLSPSPPQRYPHGLATFQTCKHYMRFSSLFNSNTRIHSWQNEAFAVTTNLTSILCWQANFCCHGYLAGYINVMLRQIGVFMISFPRQKEKRLNTLPSYTLDSSVHLLTALHPKKRFSNYKVSSQNMKRKWGVQDKIKARWCRNPAANKRNGTSITRTCIGFLEIKT